jgi:hypothetical protein
MLDGPRLDFVSAVQRLLVPGESGLQRLSVAQSLLSIIRKRPIRLVTNQT